MSPWTVMHRRKGNPFEYATALVSYLIGAEYNAYVVVGYAVRDFTLNIQQRTLCPETPSDVVEDAEEDKPPTPRYKLAELPDMRSKYVLAMEEKEQQKITDAENAVLETLRLNAEAKEAPPPDALAGFRYHAWVLVQPPHNGVAEPFFIEPSSAAKYPTHYSAYQGIDSVYDNHNYYVNLQDCANGVDNVVFDLNNLEHWEHLLAGEPTEYRSVPDPSPVDSEKHLDMPTSWVEKLHISVDDFERRYPGGHKIVHYKRTIMEKFAPYQQVDGLVKRIRLFQDYKYLKVLKQYDWYENRVDRMLTVNIDYVNQNTTEEFRSGREDFLKKHTYVNDSMPGSIEAFRSIEFFYYARFDHLQRLELTPTSLIEHYKDREDRLYIRELYYMERDVSKSDSKRQLVKISEKYNRNPDVPAREDVAERWFDLEGGTMGLVYHYAYNFVTMSTRDFVKPNLVESGGRVLFDPNMTSGYTADPTEDTPRPLALYEELVTGLELEAVAQKGVRDSEGATLGVVRSRVSELAEPRLQVCAFDTERNETAQRDWAEQMAQIQQVSEREVEAAIDPLAPYLARLCGASLCGDTPLSLKQGYLVREQCLTDFKARQLARQNIVQERFEKLNNKYKTKRLWYLANQFILSPEAEAAFFEASSELAFQVTALEVRLVRFRDLSGARFRALEQALDRHPLLKEYLRNKRYHS